jgi:hypothetical protein
LPLGKRATHSATTLPNYHPGSDLVPCPQTPE